MPTLFIDSFDGVVDRSSALLAVYNEINPAHGKLAGTLLQEDCRLGIACTPVMWRIKDTGYFRPYFDTDIDYHSKEFYDRNINLRTFLKELQAGEHQEFPCNPVDIKGIPSRIGPLQIAINYFLRYEKIAEDCFDTLMLVLDNSTNEFVMISVNLNKIK